MKEKQKMYTITTIENTMGLSQQNLKGKMEMRKHFDGIVLKRDGAGCRVCGSDSKVHAYHISSDLPHGGFVVENGILLCLDCRANAKNGDLTIDHLYSLISSSREAALQAYKKPKPLA